MTEEVLETADIGVRIYPSDYKRVSKESRKRRTSVAQIIHEALLALSAKE